jgi:DNA-binding LytR/AlgR family response regulator
MNEKHDFRVLVVEDDFLIATQLSTYITDLSYQVEGPLDNGADVIAFLQENHVDLVLLDIQLQGGMDGVDLANIIHHKHEIPVLFISSNTTDTIIERIRHTGAEGFITKPFTKEDLSTNIELIRFRFGEKKKDTEEDVFYVKHKQEFVRLPLNEILYAEALDNYTALYSEKGRFTLPQPLKQVSGKLEPLGFFRTHRSFLVRLNRIDAVQQGYVLIGKQQIPLSETNRSQLLKLLDIL